MKNSLKGWSHSWRSGIWWSCSFEKIGASEITGCHLGNLVRLTDHCDLFFVFRGWHNKPSYQWDPMWALSPIRFSELHPVSLLQQKPTAKTSLAVQWLRICLSMPETLVLCLFQEDSTCLGATEPVHHNHWSPSSRAWTPGSTTGKPTTIRIPHTAAKEQPQSPQLEKTRT